MMVAAMVTPLHRAGQHEMEAAASAALDAAAAWLPAAVEPAHRAVVEIT